MQEGKLLLLFINILHSRNNALINRSLLSEDFESTCFPVISLRMRISQLLSNDAPATHLLDRPSSNFSTVG